jgi:hypothetical protein
MSLPCALARAATQVWSRTQHRGYGCTPALMSQMVGSEVQARIIRVIIRGQPIRVAKTGDLRIGAPYLCLCG